MPPALVYSVYPVYSVCSVDSVLILLNPIPYTRYPAPCTLLFGS